jgi:2,3-bisphosphoglycerate-dependent phosphoglycerate mutase
MVMPTGGNSDMTTNRSHITSASFWVCILMLALLAVQRSRVPLASAQPTSDPPVLTVLLVRHAEKAEQPLNDPSLSPAGQERARTLTHVTQAAGIQAVYASEYLRTQQTVRPMADSLGLPIHILAADHVEQLVMTIKSDHSGQVVLVAGHSDTVPQIVEKLGAEPVSPISESTFDNLFIVTVYKAGKAKVITLKYGAPT